MTDVQQISLPQAARERYLAYAVSVITARALPDVRDGLKPVQRRILYTMYHELSLHPTGRYRKCAAIVGEVMGKYHPHGDQSIYDALVRMAQPFSLLAPLVDWQGNYGSLDGDPPAAMRYTECRLEALAEELLQELDKETVDYRPSYDSQRQEPIVLPAQFPQLLVNGSEGIAVGLATRIPPHNLGEVIDAAVAIIDGKASTVSDLMAWLPGPDLPTAGRLLNERADLLKMYEEGHGSLRVQGETTVETENRRTRVVITSIPYGQNKARLIERIGADVEEKRLPQVADVRDESKDDVRMVLDLKPGADPQAVIAWLYKRTPLECSIPVILNALVPVEGASVPAPVKLDLYSMLQHWLDFRFATVRRRFEYDLRVLRRRIHMLEGLAIVFVDLDELIRLVRSSDGKKHAAQLIMARWPLDEEQTDAILELQIYKLSRLEIQIILDELQLKEAEAAGIVELLSSEVRLMEQVRTELLELRHLYAQPRRTKIGGPAQALTFNEEAYRVHEDTYVVVTREGWIKRQSSFTDISKIRVREADEIGWLYRAGTATSITLFGRDGTAWTTKVGDIPATTGYGTPLSRLFAVDDGVAIVGVALHDPAALKQLPPDPQPNPDDPPGPHVIGITRQGRIQRIALEAYAEPSTRAGRRFARVDDNDGLLVADVAGGGESVSLISKNGNVLIFPVREANVLRGAGKGTTAMSLKDDDEVFAACLTTDTQRGVKVIASTGRTIDVTEHEFGRGSRADRGRSLFRRGTITTWLREPVVRAGDRSPLSPTSASAAVEGGEE